LRTASVSDFFFLPRRGREIGLRSPAISPPYDGLGSRNRLSLLAVMRKTLPWPDWPNFGYNLARMHFEIVLAPEAIEDRKRLTARVWAAVRDVLDTHLRHEPTKTSRSRIKRLRGLKRPQYRLRVEEVRVFYDVTGSTVEVLAIVPKSEAQTWLAQFGSPE
jgi:mRNA interferase RelE/StbE